MELRKAKKGDQLIKRRNLNGSEIDPNDESSKDKSSFEVSRYLVK